MKYPLTKEQQSAIRSLRRALKKCDEANVFLCNLYGDLQALNGEIFEKVIAREEADDNDVPVDEAAQEIVYRDDLVSWADEPVSIYAHFRGSYEREGADD